MKNLLHKMPCLILGITLACSVSAQEIVQTDIVPRNYDISLPPVNDLIDSAIKHNALVQFRSLEIDAKNCNLKSAQNYWTRNLGFQADSRYGTFDNYSSNANGQSTIISTSTNKQLNYGAGFYLKFPLGDVVDRRNLLKKANTELLQSRSMAEAQRDEVRQLVIRLYQDVLLKQRLLNIRAHALGDSRVNGEMVEKQFRNGTIQVNEYVRISDIVSRVESDFETAKTEFIISKMILEDIVGFTFTTVSKGKNENNRIYTAAP